MTGVVRLISGVASATVAANHHGVEALRAAALPERRASAQAAADGPVPGP
ncbi:MAG: hypothetical protein U0531_10175 [Dehalococcoidia bacterium]